MPCRSNDIHVVLDLTANYVTKEDELFKQATLNVPDPDALSTFITTPNANNNWLKTNAKNSEKAWQQVGKTYFLSQFGENYDLQMSNSIAQKKLTGVLIHLAGLGVKGFRLRNAKHFIVSPDLTNEQHHADHKGGDLSHYDFFEHKHTTYQPGLSELIHNFTRTVHNATRGEGFLSILDDAAERFEELVSTSEQIFSFDLPFFKFLNKDLQSTDASVPKRLYNNFKSFEESVDKNLLWMQVTYKKEQFKERAGLDGEAYNMFMSLLPGVLIVELDALNYAGNKTEVIKKLETARESQVFQHGNFDYLLSQNDTAFAYTRYLNLLKLFIKLRVLTTNTFLDFSFLTAFVTIYYY